MYVHEFPYRIPYLEVDRLNVVHHGHYAKYYETGRVEALRALGWTYREMEEQGTGLLVAEIVSKFLRPARYDETVNIITTIPEWPGRRILFETEILNEQGDICNTAQVKLLFINRSAGKVCSAPKRLLELLDPYFKSNG